MRQSPRPRTEQGKTPNKEDPICIEHTIQGPSLSEHCPSKSFDLLHFCHDADVTYRKVYIHHSFIPGYLIGNPTLKNILKWKNPGYIKIPVHWPHHTLPVYLVPHSHMGCHSWQLHISYHIHSTFKKLKHHTGSHLLIPLSGMGKHTDGSYIRLSASLRLKSSKPICMARLAPTALGPKKCLPQWHCSLPQSLFPPLRPQIP